jgi:23S rRNA pseudouridine2605 synthase
MRLQSFLSQAGIGSRRKMLDIIKAGEVTVNGTIILEPSAPVDPRHDRIVYGTKPVSIERKLYFLFHKPKGVITSSRDTHGRKTVLDFFKSSGTKERLFSVGRLDQYTTGLLVITNDGDLANRMSHPRFHLEKTYEVIVNRRLEERQLEMAERGLVIDGERCAPCKVLYQGKIQGGYAYHIILRQGRNRQIRRMMEILRTRIFTLHRFRMGPLELQDLKSGAYRPLSASEIEKLRDASKEGPRFKGSERGRRPFGNRRPSSGSGESGKPGDRPKHSWRGRGRQGRRPRRGSSKQHPNQSQSGHQERKSEGPTRSLRK